MKTSLLSVIVGLGCVLGTSAASTFTAVRFLRTPDGGIQPQAMADSKGVIHLVYFKGKPGGGDLFYTRIEPGTITFGQAIPINSQPGSAIAAGTIRGAQLALGRNGRVHVAWNGSKSLDGGSHAGAPMLYSRLNDAGTAFETERDLMTSSGGLDGGGAVAADDKGNVFVFWHGSPPGNSQGEAGRAVFVARSTDDGKTFSRETQANPKPTGACGCCGMRAFVDGQGHLFALYRAASEKVNRDEILLVSRDQGASFEIANAHPWNIATCPMSSASLSETRAGTLAAWESAGQVFFARVDAQTLQVAKPVSPPGTGKRKHPVAVGNATGDVLLAWAEGTGWQRGGAVAWQLFDAEGKPKPEPGRVPEGVPVWGLVAAVTRPDGSFIIIH